MIRIFLGIPIPNTIKKSLSSLQGGIPGAKWVSEENYHITLQFIGEVPENIKEDIAEALEYIAYPNFELTLTGLGLFTTGEIPHHLFIKPTPDEPLIILHRKLDQLLKSEFKIKGEERKYTPHLTLAHFKNPNIDKVGKFLEWHNLYRSQTFKVTEYILYQSTITNNGSVYEPLDIYTLDE